MAILGTAPLATAMIAAKKPCLLTSDNCAGKKELAHCLPCCCEQRLGPAANIQLFSSLEGKFQGNGTELLKWNGVKRLQVGQRLQLCFDDEAIAARRKRQQAQRARRAKKIKQKQKQRRRP